MVIVLIGKYTESVRGVEKEIPMANNNNVPIFGIYVGGADSSSNLPDGLARSHVIAWGWDEIPTKIDEMMSQEKNK